MLKKRLEYSRAAAIVVILAMSGSGVKALISSFADTANYGTIKITSYAFRDGAPREKIGNVRVEVEPVGSTEGCGNNSGTTNASETEGDKGSVTLENCRVRNAAISGFDGKPTYMKVYKLKIPPTRDGWEYRGARMNVGNDVIRLNPVDGAENEFIVDKDKVSSLQVWMEDKTPSPPPANTPPPASDDKKASMEVTSYIRFSDTQLERIGNTKVILNSIGQDNNNAAVRCNEKEKTTDSAGGSQAASPNYGQANFTNCWTSSDHSKGYKFDDIIAPPGGYTFRSIHLTDGDKFANGGTGSTNKNETFQLRQTKDEGHKTTLSIWFDPPPGATPPADQPDPVPGAKDKNGQIQVVSYVFESGKLERIGNVKVTVNSVGVDNSKADKTCDTTTEKTDSKGGSEQANANYGQAHFLRCWTGSEGKKQYEVSGLEIPSGYAFSSLRIDGGAFAGGGTSANDLKPRFDVVPKGSNNKETKLQVWLHKVALPADPAPSEGGEAGSEGGSGGASGPTIASSQAAGGAVHQVLSKTGSSYVAARNNEASKTLATILNNLIGTNQLELDYGIDDGGNGGEGDCDPEIDICSGVDEACPDFDGDGCPDKPGEGEATPPTAPSDLTAVQDDAGAVTLTWAASTGNPPGEAITYTIQRFDNAAGGDPVETSLDNLTQFVDTGTEDSELGELTYPNHEYTYRIFAEDENMDPSDQSATVTFVTKPIKANVGTAEAAQQQPADDEGDDAPPPAETGAAPTPEAAPSDNQTVTNIPSNNPNVAAAATVPKAANETPMACSVSNGDSNSLEMLAGVGNVQGSTAQLVCRQENGDEVQEFDEDVEFSMEIDEDELNDTELYAYDGTDWEEILADDEDQSSNSDGKNGTIEYASASREKAKVKGAKAKLKVKSKKPLKLATIKKNHPSAAKQFMYALPPIIFVAGVAIFILWRRRLVPMIEKIPNPLDINLMPTKDAVPPPQPVNQVQPQVPVNNSGVQAGQVIRPEGQPAVQPKSPVQSQPTQQEPPNEIK